MKKKKTETIPPDEITPSLKIDDKTLKDIIKKLYYPESPYEFSVLPADILGHVYEQFLGKVIRLTPAHYAVVEDKPEVKKAGGVYYTPTYIVDYIVKNTVGKILEKKTLKQVENISVLDPACGSGSFLLGAYQYLLDWHLKYYTDNVERISDLLKKKRPPIYQIRKNEYLLTTSERKRILLNNIFGVDIDSQAVEVTKLSLLLKVLEGESEETLTNQMRMFRERALPDLANNIKCGNSLIGPDFYEQMEMNFLNDEEKLKINVFDWKAEFKKIMESGGFDVVIGNPPWIQSKFLNTIEKKYYGNKYATVSNQYDLFCLFTEKSMKLLNKKGIHSFIVPNRFFTNHDYYNFRKFLIDFTGIVELFDVGEKIFDKVEMPSTIYLLKNNSSKVIKYKYVLGKFLNNKIVCNQVDIDSVKKDEFLFFKVTGSIDLSVVCEKIKINEPLKNFVTNARGVEIGKKSEVITNEKINDSVKFLVGEDISRYTIKYKNKFLIKGRFGINYKKGNLYEGEKILLRKTGHGINATLDTYNYWVIQVIYIFKMKINIKENIRYILGIINSKLINVYYYETFGEKFKEVFPHFRQKQFLELPIKKINFKIKKEELTHNRIVTLVNDILIKKEQFHKTKTPQEKTALQRQIDATDKQIDKLVYQLYGLTEEEIKIVELEN